MINYLQYPKSVGTQESGYLSKKLTAALQTEQVDVNGTDCGSDEYVIVTITDKNKSNYLYRYIKDGSNLVCLDTTTLDKYVGKEVKMRSPLYCRHNKICSKCAGQMPYRMDSPFIGLSCLKFGTVLTNLNMKKFHVSNMKSSKLNVDDLLI